VTAALLVFVEVMKELPATLLLRPLGGDTMAIAVWQATTESLYRTAALPALMIVLVGLLPVALMIRLSGRVGASEVEASPAAGGWVDEPEAAAVAA
jgi:iron(III) transport system permease protein